MAKKRAPAAGGAPDWVLTYGDMMSLLLTFFILLAALSELKREDEYAAIAEEVKKNFGTAGGGGTRSRGMLEPKVSISKQLEGTGKNPPSPANPEVRDDSIKGKHLEVQSLKQEQIFSVGARITFEPGSAELSKEMRDTLKNNAGKIRGYSNRIELRGHASNMEQQVHPDLWALSFARSRAVMLFLTGPEMNIESNRIKLSAAGDTEPVVLRKYKPDEHAPNRRVDILVSNHLLTDAPPAYSD